MIIWRYLMPRLFDLWFLLMRAYIFYFQLILLFIFLHSELSYICTAFVLYARFTGVHIVTIEFIRHYRELSAYLGHFFTQVVTHKDCHNDNKYIEMRWGKIYEGIFRVIDPTCFMIRIHRNNHFLQVAISPWVGSQ